MINLEVVIDSFIQLAFIECQMCARLSARC